MSANKYSVSAYNGKPAIYIDSPRGEKVFTGFKAWTDAMRACEEWNRGEFRQDEVQTIAEHFLIAAAWADAPEGTHPRATNKAIANVCELVREFIAAADYRVIRAALQAYKVAGLHPDCNGDPCAALGHDLYLTLAGHGVGFCDRDCLLSSMHFAGFEKPSISNIGEYLTEKCRNSRFRDCHGLDFYRGWVHFTL